MFKKLRNKLILINLSVTSAVIIVAFTAVYLISTGVANHRRPFDEQGWEVNGSAVDFPGDFERFLAQTVQEEREKAAQTLLVALIVSGLSIELIVALVSYFLAEEAIKPIRESYEAQKIFIANASHEIKTPLAAITANLEAADITGNRFIDNVERETRKLAELNDELLALARSDIKKKSDIRLVDLSRLVERVLDGLEPRLGDKKLVREIAAGDKVKIAAKDFEQLVGILMDNAIKYSASEIEVKLEARRLTVKNDGKTIPTEKLAHIFERFYQVDKTADGVGLGLAIAKSVCEQNHWKIKAESQRGMTSFIVEL